MRPPPSRLRPWAECEEADENKNEKAFELAAYAFVQIANALDIPADILLAEQLTGSVMAASQEITMLLTDCSDYERMVITDTVKAMKTSLRDHKSVLTHTDR